MKILLTYVISIIMIIQKIKFQVTINITIKIIQPLSLWQTNIYPVKTYEKLCSWLEVLVDEIYPWSNETHFGSIGGYT